MTRLSNWEILVQGVKSWKNKYARIFVPKIKRLRLIWSHQIAFNESLPYYKIVKYFYSEKKTTCFGQARLYNCKGELLKRWISVNLQLFKRTKVRITNKGLGCNSVFRTGHKTLNIISSGCNF